MISKVSRLNICCSVFEKTNQPYYSCTFNDSTISFIQVLKRPVKANNPAEDCFISADQTPAMDTAQGWLGISLHVV